MRLLIVCLMLPTLASCMSVGTQVQPESAQAFQKGATSYDDVVAKLGEPQREETSSDGARTAVYTYAQTQVRPESFIPYVGLIAGGADTKTTSVAFRFDAKGRLIDYTTTKGQAGAGYGLEALK